MEAAEFPPRIWIEPTNICNLRCPFCPYKNMKREKGMMPLKEYKKLVDEIAGHRLIEFWLQNYGESTLNPDFIEMIKYADQKGIYPIIYSTNCTTLDNKLAEEILTSGLDFLILSLDGATRETYEKLREGANYDKVVENIKNIYLKKKELGLNSPGLVLQIVYSNETQDEIIAYAKQWAPYLTKTDQISLKEYNDFAGQVEIKTAREKDFQRMPCKVLFENIVILWNGDATPCCLDVEGKLGVGNVLQTSIAEVWSGEKFKKLRGSVNNGTFEGLELCRKCTMGIGRAKGTFTPKQG